MKAVILVGGLGTRLRPLTCTLPKPLLPLLNRPFIEYTVKLLKKHGIAEIIFSSGYLPELFEEHFRGLNKLGIKVHHVVETEPLGTCGAVKNVQDLLGETFIVFNGDILTDLNLSYLIDYHKTKKALATLTLTSVENPTIYGLVPINHEGRVLEFLEKPSWDEVTTDLVNAGTYVLEPEVLDYVPSGENYSFERGLFPVLLEKNLPLFGFPSGAYWLDIGSPEKYLQAHHDLLEGKLAFEFGSKEVKPRVWVGKGTKLSPQAHLFGPVVLGENCKVDDYVSVVGPTCIGNKCFLGKGSRVEGSLLLDGCFLHEGVVVRNSILGREVQVGAKVHVEEFSVLGDKMKIGEGNWFKKGIKIWPETEIGPGTIRF